MTDNLGAKKPEARQHVFKVVMVGDAQESHRAVLEGEGGWEILVQTFLMDYIQDMVEKKEMMQMIKFQVESLKD